MAFLKDGNRAPQIIYYNKQNKLPVDSHSCDESQIVIEKVHIISGFISGTNESCGWKDNVSNAVVILNTVEKSWTRLYPKRYERNSTRVHSALTKKHAS